MPELRKDPVTGRWVIIATERGVRPKDYTLIRQPLSEQFCPFCPGNESATPSEVLAFRPDGGDIDQPGWSLRVVPNKFPALRVEGDLDKHAQGLYDMMNGVGAHEVIIETPEHDAGLAQLPTKAVEDVLWAYRERLLDLSNDARLRYASVFKNHGAPAGATLHHAHSQLIALPIIPRQITEEMDGSAAYFKFRDRCVYCDIVHQELASGDRIVYENEHVVALCPFASRSPFETWIIPRQHAARFEASPAALYRATAEVLRAVLRKLYKALDNPPFNYMLHTAPFGDQPMPHYHWHLEVVPTLTHIAGFEWGSGFYINPTPPERAAEFMRSVEVEV